jgi:hypothetical protein
MNNDFNAYLEEQQKLFNAMIDQLAQLIIKRIDFIENGFE